jgi:hypothetical protein
MNNSPWHLDPDELREWQLKIEIANQHNIWCHCRQCDREWIASAPVACECGSVQVEHIACWQFPDD